MRVLRYTDLDENRPQPHLYPVRTAAFPWAANHKPPSSNKNLQTKAEKAKWNLPLKQVYIF